MATTADVVLWLSLAALILVVLLRTLGSLQAGLRFVRSASVGSYRRELLAPLAITFAGGLALAAEPFAATLRGAGPWFGRGLVVAFGFGLTWLVASLLSIAVRTLLARHDTAVADNLTARRVHTQYRVLLRIALILVWVFGAAVMLSTIPEVRTLGNGLLASAGIVGLVLGLAAQRTIGNFLAGIQIALTQPVRLDDAVVIDGEWGWIEDITTTYVVVKIWDERRLIVPFSRLLEQPFQVVECSERAIQLRALCSASSSPRAWDLRCHVREKLVQFVAREQPAALPTVRAEVESAERVRRHAPAELPIADPGLSEPDIGGLPGEPEPHGDVAAGSAGSAST